MGWITEDDKTYWLPNELPQNTNEWNSQQENKQYLTPNGDFKTHPKWFYGNQALVDDDYLFYNEGWKLVISNPPVEENGYKVIERPQEEWVEEEKTITKLYYVYEIISSQKPEEYFEVEITLDYTYDNINLTATETWNIRQLTQEEILSKEEDYFNKLRSERNQLLSNSDYIITKAFEQGLTLTQDIKNYRQQLRDLPQNVNIREVNFDTVYPTIPVNFYVV